MTPLTREQVEKLLDDLFDVSKGLATRRQAFYSMETTDAALRQELADARLQYRQIRDTLEDCSTDEEVRLRQRVEELTRHLNLVDMVPRSRYDAANQDWLTAIKERDAARVAATGEIADLTAKLAQAQATIAAREREVDVMQAQRDLAEAKLARLTEPPCNCGFPHGNEEPHD